MELTLPVDKNLRKTMTSLIKGTKVRFIILEEGTDFVRYSVVGGSDTERQIVSLRISEMSA